MAMKVAAVVVVMVLATTAVVAMAGPVEYEVAWDFPSTPRYYSATQGRVYKVGDTLKFVYEPALHNVVKVGDVQDFQSCTTSTALGPEYTNGETSMTLDKPGPHYFICSVPGHCTDGMKIKVIAK